MVSSFPFLIFQSNVALLFLVLSDAVAVIVQEMYGKQRVL